MRAVIFGVDGLTFRVLHPLMERGELPHFRKLAQEGCEAILESKYPPLTPPAWISLSTGLKPARHGVYDFWTYEEQQKQGLAPKARVQTTRKSGKAIWNILSEYGKQVLVVNVPMTYPPEAVNGIMVSGYMTPSSDLNFTYPATFKEELYRIVPNYQIDLELHKIWGQPIQVLIDATLRMTERRIELIMYLLKEKPWDFCYVAFVGPDRLQHTLWEEIRTLDSHATEYFRLLDHGLGLILEQLGPDDNLFVVSDHGFQGATHLFDINEYLYSKGLLIPDASYRHQRAHRIASLKRLLERTGLLGPMRRMKSMLTHAGALKEYVSDLYHPLLTDLDWERTLAYVPSNSGFGGGYANIFFSNDLGDARLAELQKDLQHQIHPETGQPLVDAAYTNEVFGEGPYAPREPHLLVLPADGITFRMTLGNSQLWDKASAVRGTHQKDGVLYAYGNNIKRGCKAPNAEIYDLVPTVLRSMGLPLPHPFDGRVLDELFIEQRSLEERPVTEGIASSGERTRRKLRKLLEV